MFVKVIPIQMYVLLSWINFHDGEDNRFHSGNIGHSMTEMIAFILVWNLQNIFRKKKSIREEIREIIKYILEEKERWYHRKYKQ